MALRFASGLKPLGQLRYAVSYSCKIRVIYHEFQSNAAAYASAQDVLAATNKASLTELSNGFRIASVENNRPLTTVSL